MYYYRSRRPATSARSAPRRSNATEHSSARATNTDERFDRSSVLYCGDCWRCRRTDIAMPGEAEEVWAESGGAATMSLAVAT